MAGARHSSKPPRPAAGGVTPGGPARFPFRERQMADKETVTERLDADGQPAYGITELCSLRRLRFWPIGRLI